MVVVVMVLAVDMSSRSDDRILGTPRTVVGAIVYPVLDL